MRAQFSHTMWSAQRSTTAHRDHGITAGLLLIMVLASTLVSTEAQTDSPQSNSALPSGTDSSHSTILTTDISSLQDPTTTQLVSTPDVVISPTKPQTEPTTKRATQGGSTESAGIATTETSTEDDAVDNVNLATTSLLPISQGIATDDVSLTPADVSITANITGGSGHDTTEDALALEFLVVIITTVIIILGLLILIAAIVFYCCKKRSEKPSRFVKFKKGRGKYDKMDLEMGNTLPRNDPGGGAWIFKANDGSDEQELEPMNLDLRTTHLTNDNYDPEVNGNIDISPSISDYHSGTNHGLVATLELDDDDNDLNVNPMYASPGLSASHGSTKDSGIHGSGSDELGDPDRSIRSDNDLQSFADDTVEL